MLTTEVERPDAIPYFVWDQPMTVAEIRHLLAEGNADEKFRLLGKIMREARDRDVWKFTNVIEVRDNWDKLSRYLGRRRSYWEFMFGLWEKEGLIG